MAFKNITAEEMSTFLTTQGFTQLFLPGTVELVFGKLLHVDSHTLCLRVYTAINPSGESREKGSDAIRLQLYWRFDQTPVPIGNPQRCLRVDNWEKNLLAAIERSIDDQHYKVCPKCQSPLHLRNGFNGLFWGCCTWHKTKCNGHKAA